MRHVVRDTARTRQEGTVKLTKSSSIDPQDTGLEPAVNPPCWGSETAVSLNLTIPIHLLDTARAAPAESAAGHAVSVYTDPVVRAAATVIRMAHLTELRAAALE